MIRQFIGKQFDQLVRAFEFRHANLTRVRSKWPRIRGDKLRRRLARNRYRRGVE